MEFSTAQFDRAGLAAWQAGQPLSVLQLDTADRTVLRIAGSSVICLLARLWHEPVYERCWWPIKKFCKTDNS